MHKFKNGISTQIDSSCLEVVASWIEAIHGQGELAHGLSSLRGLLNANTGILARFSDGHARPKILACTNEVARKSQSNTPNTPIAHLILGQHMSTIKTGKVFVLSELDQLSMTADRMRLNEQMSEHGLRNVALISLDTHGDKCDILELHFVSDISVKDRAAIENLTTILSDSWKKRRVGTALNLINDRRRNSLSLANDAPPEPILNSSNPNRLSRSEFRVCSLIKEGMVAKEIALTLEIRQSTVRSHLRSIYFKTETSGQIELLHRLGKDRERTENSTSLTA